MRLLPRLVLVFALLPVLGGTCAQGSSGSGDDDDDGGTETNCLFSCSIDRSSRLASVESESECNDECIDRCNAASDSCFDWVFEDGSGDEDD